MKKETDDIKLIIIRYLDDSASLGEKRQLLQWFEESSQHRADFTEIRDLWLSCTATSDDEQDFHIAIERLRARIMNENKQLSKPRLYFSIRRLQTVAMIALLIGMSYLLSVTYFSKPEIIVQNQLITAKGSKGQFILPDGTMVWLNSESQLTYPDKFVGRERIVTLKGGAYFEVEKNKEKPFVVQTGEIKIEVLGTSFNISDYDRQQMFSTALLEGSIQISAPFLKERLMLKPGQLFEYNEKEHSMKVSHVNTALYSKWIKEKLIFDNNKLSDIIICLEGWYNMDIDCPKDFAANTQMSFTLQGENINEILRAMSLIAPIQYTIENNTVKIRPRN